MKLSDSTRGQMALRKLSRRWLLLLVIPAIIGAAAYFSEASRPERFQSSSSVLIQTTDLGAILAGVPDLSNSDPTRRIATEQVIASVPQVRTRALGVLAVPGDSPLAQSATIDFGADKSFTTGDTDVLRTTVVAGDAQFAERLATAVAEQYIAFRAEVANAEISKARDQVRKRMREIQGNPGASAEFTALVNRAEKLETLLLLGTDRARLLTSGSEASQVAPNPLRRGIVGAILGLLLAAALVFVIERFDKSVGSEDEIPRLLSAPIIARLPDPRQLGRRSTVISLSEPAAAETEAFRLLRANLRFSLLSRPGHSVGVTSALEGEGKSFVATNLAVVAAGAGARVLLVDLDLRRPTVHRVMGLDRTPGLSDVLTGRVSLEDALHHIPLSGDLDLVDSPRGSLAVLSAGTETPNPGELCASVALRDLLQVLEDQCELLVVDTPPVTVVTDAVPIASSVSGMLSVVRGPSARKPTLEALRDSLDGAGGSMGVVLTAAWKAPSSYARYKSPATEESVETDRTGSSTRLRTQ